MSATNYWQLSYPTVSFGRANHVKLALGLVDRQCSRLGARRSSPTSPPPCLLVSSWRPEQIKWRASARWLAPPPRSIRLHPARPRPLPLRHVVSGCKHAKLWPQLVGGRVQQWFYTGQTCRGMGEGGTFLPRTTFKYISTSYSHRRLTAGTNKGCCFKVNGWGCWGLLMVLIPCWSWTLAALSTFV